MVIMSLMKELPRVTNSTMIKIKIPIATIESSTDPMPFVKVN